MFLLFNISEIPHTCCGFCVSNKEGVSGIGLSGSEVRNLKFTIAEDSARKVTGISCESQFPDASVRESRILLVIPMTRSQTPLICEAYGRLNSQVQSILWRYFLTPTKFVSLLDLKCVKGPRIATNRFKAI